MADDRVQEIIKYFEQNLLKSGLKIYRVVLFGSAYRGNFSDESDIDIAVVSDDFVGKTIFERAELAGDAVWETIKKFKVALDVVKLTVDEYENETRMIASYVKEGKVVYSAN
ncbi:MAG: nucleotidyltransferase domain-containing protein [Bacteroidetes bacterium]|nr:nucleotidyltransferase domain-containing protein [Bacteroidota bacterium]